MKGEQSPKRSHSGKSCRKSGERKRSTHCNWISHLIGQAKRVKQQRTNERRDREIAPFGYSDC
jgi:hypothetical protein